jgi:hypothetical protein
VGVERRQELLDDVANQGTFLPRGTYLEDLDQSFVEFVERDLEIISEGEKVPVLFLTISRWSEFSRTWQFSDKFKNIKMPFITVVRKPDVQEGTNQAGLWNIAQGNKTYTYMKVPTWDGNIAGVDIYKIPQPTSVDVNYEVRLFCNKMRDVNKIHSKVRNIFQSKQAYTKVNGHPMPITNESVVDESPTDDFENRRFYTQMFEMKLAGYLLNEDDFEVVPAVNRMLLLQEVEEDVSVPSIKFVKDNSTGLVTYNFVVKPNADTDFCVTPEFDIKFTELLLIQNVNGVTIKINDVVQTYPFVISAGQTMRFIVNKNFTTTAKFILKGNLI